MGILGNLFKPNSQSDADAKRSTEIIDYLKLRRGQETGKWLSLMQNQGMRLPSGPPPTIEDVDKREQEDSFRYAPPMSSQYMTMGMSHVQAPPRPSEPEHQENETVEWVNIVFAEFSHQAQEYNASAVGSQLLITVRAPEYTFEQAQFGGVYDAHKKLSVFKGHIATMHWAMLVQGYEENIDIYVVPAEEILNVSLNDIRKMQVSPFMTIASTKQDEHRVWNVGGTTVSAEMIPLLTKELLGDLIRIAAGTMTEAELFADHRTGLKLGETVAKGYVAPAATSAVAASAPQQSDNPFASLACWAACDALLNAIDKDMSEVTSSEGDLDPEKDKAAVERVRALATALRTLSGNVSALVAQYRPGSGSKYNAS